MQVKRVAEDKYNYTFGNESVSTFVTAFYDAVLLYGLALNETLARGGNQSDGEAIVKAMWNKTFSGITGRVNIDANGDRIADYSLLDMDPESNEFKVLRVCVQMYGIVFLGYVFFQKRGSQTTTPIDTVRKTHLNNSRHVCETSCVIRYRG